MRIVRAWIGAAAMTSLLAGCAGTSPTTSASEVGDAATVSAIASPSPTTSAGPPVTVVISATDITLLDAGGARVGGVPYAAGLASVEVVLDRALGPHAAEDYGQCSLGVWGDGEQTVSVTQASGQQDVEVLVKTATLGGIGIRSSAGFAVGDDISSLLATLPPAQIDTDISQAVFELVPSSSATTPRGAVALFDATGHALNLFAPSVPKVEVCG